MSGFGKKGTLTVPFESITGLAGVWHDDDGNQHPTYTKPCPLMIKTDWLTILSVERINQLLGNRY
jgi:hypothetical protein